MKNIIILHLINVVEAKTQRLIVSTFRYLFWISSFDFYK
jgi:hypothetical protein